MSQVAVVAVTCLRGTRDPASVYSGMDLFGLFSHQFLTWPSAQMEWSGVPYWLLEWEGAQAAALLGGGEGGRTSIIHIPLPPSTPHSSTE